MAGRQRSQMDSSGNFNINHLYKFIYDKCSSASTFLCLKTICEAYNKPPRKVLPDGEILYNQALYDLINHDRIGYFHGKSVIKVIYILRIPAKPRFLDQMRIDFHIETDINNCIISCTDKKGKLTLGWTDNTIPVVSYETQHDLLHFMAEHSLTISQPVADEELARQYAEKRKTSLPISELAKQMNIVKPAILKEQTYIFHTRILMAFMTQYPVDQALKKKMHIHGTGDMDGNIIITYTSNDGRIKLEKPATSDRSSGEPEVRPALQHFGVMKAKRKRMKKKLSDTEEQESSSQDGGEFQETQEESPSTSHFLTHQASQYEEDHPGGKRLKTGRKRKSKQQDSSISSQPIKKTASISSTAINDMPVINQLHTNLTPASTAITPQYPGISNQNAIVEREIKLEEEEMTSYSGFQEETEMIPGINCFGQDIDEPQREEMLRRFQERWFFVPGVAPDSEIPTEHTLNHTFNPAMPSTSQQYYDSLKLPGKVSTSEFPKVPTQNLEAIGSLPSFINPRATGNAKAPLGSFWSSETYNIISTMPEPGVDKIVQIESPTPPGPTISDDGASTNDSNKTDSPPTLNIFSPLPTRKSSVEEERSSPAKGCITRQFLKELHGAFLSLSTPRCSEIVRIITEKMYKTRGIELTRVEEIELAIHSSIKTIGKNRQLAEESETFIDIAALFTALIKLIKELNLESLSSLEQRLVELSQEYSQKKYSVSIETVKHLVWNILDTCVP
ncbi:hypothetical protein GCK72_020222 [Caenorhabditis remanei]|uniref:SPK domain-containing protein n=1 Tax=Caenorhabditis remanei TaxID=31234 RepID=A0A6A5GG92_CAERE|nr:hypothetical protein GCK72_020222 [Caenorhabditis remanei]KAF1753665.1 hypothetical protein GCK72_020222 [Caenorhabditis remanei]